MEDIVQALDKVCPEKEQIIKTKPPSWWTTELHNLRRKAKIAWKHWKKLSSNPEAEQGNISKKYNAYKGIKKLPKFSPSEPLWGQSWGVNGQNLVILGCQC